MRAHLARLLRRVDHLWTRWSVGRLGESDGLVTVLFHTLLEDRAELRRDLLHPQQRTTVADLRRFLEHFLEAGYRFLDPEEILEDATGGPGRRAVLTFDDGYHNNLRALPVLRELGVPAILFVTTDHVDLQRAFWWDVVWRERRRRATSETAIEREIRSLKALPPDAIAERLTAEFGARSLDPVCDLDRPLTAQEVAALGPASGFHVGNHTTDHAILPLLDVAEAGRRIRQAQDRLAELSGRPPVAIAYPNGDLSVAVVNAARDAGLRLGWTLQPRKERPAPGRSPERDLSLGRFVLWGNRDIDEQCRLFRADHSLYTLVKNRGRG